MKKVVLTTITALLLAALILFPAAKAQEIKAVFERGGELFTMKSDGQVVQITRDGMSKELPLWSKDGTRIAYVRVTDPKLALGELVVIRSDGRSKTVDSLIRPVDPNLVQNMRFIERLEWLTTDKIAISGSINPSTEESLVIDLNTAKEIVNYYDDTGGAVFSPDGKHVAYISGAPHFSAAADTRPTFNIDDRWTYPAEDSPTDFLSEATWSLDSTSVAILAQNRKFHAVVLAHCRVSAGCKEIPLPETSAGRPLSIQSLEAGIVVTAQGAGRWVLGDGALRESTDFVPKSNTSLPPDTKREADSLVIGMRQKIRELGGRSEDFWCATGPLSKLPRKTAE